MAYKCIKSLTTTSNLMYYYGSQITESIYKVLTPHEKKHFVKIIQDFPQKKKLDDGDLERRIEEAAFPLWASSDNDDWKKPTEQSDSNSSFDYGGGDSGGSGSSGGWDSNDSSSNDNNY